ncbi:hypothetical protein N9B31_09415 [Mariniblastus sp.]|nr:hypothetical protein [bacterium]MDA7903866.1 hypothetical protein [Mariniblastus sp.]MDA7904353.1 hypothetical protein [bacterium]MDA7924584.1 hypothetical protein [Mariniblastus sp.]MDA7926261.1 hypothetical protein [Mariniblastus sp.]
MGFWKVLFGKRQFTYFDDAYAFTRESLWNSLQGTLKSDRYANQPVWLVVHFFDTFTWLQDQLDESDIPYEIETSAIDAKRLSYDTLVTQKGVRLVLAKTLLSVGDSSNPDVDLERSLAVIVLERHPLLEHDLRIERIARSFPVRVEYGHYLALDDAVVRMVVNDATIKILQQMGMNDHELITSTMVTRRLKKVLRRMQSSFQFDRDADSAPEWIELNSKN